MKVRGSIRMPPDKSISHRALILSSIADGRSEMYNILESADTETTFNILKECGIRFEGDFRYLTVYPSKMKESTKPLYCANSGTTARMLMGLFAGMRGFFVLYGDDALSRRPMKRVVEPLSLMGASIMGRNDGNFLPVAISGGDLHAIHYRSLVASAQVKSAVLIAALFADGEVIYEEPYKSRDHTERMLAYMGIDINVIDRRIRVLPGKLRSLKFKIPGDFSSAAFFLTLGVIHPDADLTVEEVGLNPTRTGFLRVLEKMGAHIDVDYRGEEVEPYGNIRISTSRLRGITVEPSDVPAMIDELPLVALLGAFAEGDTMVRGAEELRFKESDRISAVVNELCKMGVNIEELEDGFIVHGGTGVHSSLQLDSHKDHRIAMMLSIASLCTEKQELIDIEGSEWVKISYPAFFDTLKEVVWE